MANRYSYEELKNKAKIDPTQENIKNLVEWFESYGMDAWNGQCFDADDLGCIYPIYAEKEDEDLGCTPITGYEIR